MSTPTNHSLNYVPKSNFSSLIKPHSYFYSNVTGMEKAAINILSVGMSTVGLDRVSRELNLASVA
jgi:hypothetical protein